jgi:hypothetical protein
MPPTDSEKSEETEKNDAVRNAVNDLSLETEGAKMLHVVRLLKVSG